jgi:hypothetical protein
MDLNWITNPLAIYGVLATGGVASLHLVVSTKLEMRRQQKHQTAECASLQQTLVALKGQVAELSCESAEKSAVPSSALTGFNVQKRSEALRMCRRGCDAHTIAAALGMTQAEVDLIKKVHLMAGAPATSVVTNLHQDSAKPLHDFSSSAMYSAEA